MRKLSQEQKDKISKSLKKFFQNNSIWNKGVKHSLAQRVNISDGLKKFYSSNIVWNKGIPMVTKGSFKKSHIPWNKGKHNVQKPIVWTEKMRNRLKEIQSGKNNSNWNGGTSSLRELIRNSSEWRNWRMQVFVRDNYTCQSCGNKKDIQPHHKKPFSVYIQLRFDVDNGLTLCKNCHKKTDSYGSKIHLRKRGEFGGHPERIIPSQAEKSEGVTVRDEIIPISAPHSS